MTLTSTDSITVAVRVRVTVCVKVAAVVALFWRTREEGSRRKGTLGMVIELGSWEEIMVKTKVLSLAMDGESTPSE
jgi:hypothetical protein